MTKDENLKQLKSLIRSAFAQNSYPTDTSLVRSGGEEPSMVRDAFEGKTNWQALSAEFVDQAPKGLSSALSFLSRHALQFFLPAYLLHDLDEKLECVDVVFFLTHGFTDESKDQEINAELYGYKTWTKESAFRYSLLGKSEVFAIISYLESQYVDKK